VELGHQCMDLCGTNLNRVYQSVTRSAHPSIYAVKAAFLAAHQHQGRLRLYLDLHAHSTRRGVFLLGKSHRMEARLFAYLLARRCSAFEYGQSKFLDEVPGTGRNWAVSKTGEPLCFTLEANYCRGHHSLECFTPETWRDIGGQCLEAFLEVNNPEGWRPGLPSFQQLRDSLLLGEHPLKVNDAARAIPRFAWFAEQERYVEVVDGNERLGFAWLHECDGGIKVEWSALKFQASQRGRFRYRALVKAQVTSQSCSRSSRLIPIEPGTEVVVEERRVVNGELRLKIAAEVRFSPWRGGWVSEYNSTLFDPRLGGSVAMMRLESSSS